MHVLESVCVCARMCAYFPVCVFVRSCMCVCICMFVHMREGHSERERARVCVSVPDISLEGRGGCSIS